MASTLLMYPSVKDENAVHGCDCRGDMVVRTRKVLELVVCASVHNCGAPSFFPHFYQVIEVTKFTNLATSHLLIAKTSKT